MSTSSRFGTVHTMRRTGAFVMVWVSNSSWSSGDWKMDEVAAVGDPPHPA